MDHCKDVAHEGRFADQKYLDDWPERFAAVHVLKHPGANLAPWNLASHQLTWNDRRQWVEVDGRELLFFHFHDMQVHWRRIWEMPGRYWAVRSTGILKRRIYRPYVEAWTRALKELPQPRELMSNGPLAERGNESLRQGALSQRLLRIAKLALQGRLIWH